MSAFRFFSALLLVFSAAALHAEDEPVLLTVLGATDTPLKLTAAAWKKLPRQSVHAKEKNGQEIVFQGVLVSDVLKEAGIKFADKSTRGETLLKYVTVEASDGYKVLFALSDFDSDLTGKTFLLADTADDKPLDAKGAPLRLVIPDEKLHARWVRQITTLKIVRSPDAQKPAEDKKHP